MASRVNIPMADALKMVGGGLLGAGIALLLAPQAGKDTRKCIVRYARTIGRKTDEAVHDFADHISEFTDSVGVKASEIMSSGSELTPQARKHIIAAIERGQEKLEKQKSKLARMMS